MKKGERRVLKKGKIIYTRSGSEVIRLANNLVKSLKPYCKRIEIAGSIRRKVKKPVDIDLIVIPKNKDKTLAEMNDQEWQEFLDDFRQDDHFEKLGNWISEK